MTGAVVRNVTSGGVVGVWAGWPNNYKQVGGYLIGPEANLTGAHLAGADLGLQPRPREPHQCQPGRCDPRRYNPLPPRT